MAGFFSALLDPNTKAKYKIKKPNQAPTTQPSRVSTNRFAMNVRPGDTLGGDIIGGKSGPVFEAASPGDAINRIARNYTVDVGDATSRIIQDTFLGGKGQSNLLDYSLVQPNTGITALDNIVKYNPTNLLLGNFLNNKDFSQVLAPGDVVPVQKAASLTAKGVKAGLPFAREAWLTNPAVREAAQSAVETAAYTGPVGSAMSVIGNLAQRIAKPTQTARIADNVLLEEGPFAVPQYVPPDKIEFMTDPIRYVGEMVGDVAARMEDINTNYADEIDRIGNDTALSDLEKAAYIREIETERAKAIKETVKAIEVTGLDRRSIRGIARGDAYDELEESFDLDKDLTLEIAPVTPQMRASGLAKQRDREQYKAFLDAMVDSGLLTADERKIMMRETGDVLREKSEDIMSGMHGTNDVSINIVGYTKDGKRTVHTIKDDPDHIIPQAAISKTGTEYIDSNPKVSMVLAKFTNSPNNFMNLFETANRYEKSNYWPQDWLANARKKSPDDPAYAKDGFYTKKVDGAFAVLRKELKRAGLTTREANDVIERIYVNSKTIKD